MDNLAILKDLLKQFDIQNMPIKENTTFDELGFDSYSLVDFILAVEEKFGVVISDDKIMNLSSIHDVLQEIQFYKTQEEEESC